MIKLLKYASLFAKCNRSKPKMLKKFHLTWVTLGVGGKAKMESGHTFLCFFGTLP